MVQLVLKSVLSANILTFQQMHANVLLIFIGMEKIVFYVITVESLMNMISSVNVKKGLFGLRINNLLKMVIILIQTLDKTLILLEEISILLEAIPSEVILLEVILLEVILLEVILLEVILLDKMLHLILLEVKLMEEMILFKVELQIKIKSRDMGLVF